MNPAANAPQPVEINTTRPAPCEGGGPALILPSTMAILKIARMGHPVLRRLADPVPDPAAPELRRLVADMEETLADIGGAPGSAAPQVHVALRVVIFRVPAERAGVNTSRPDDQPQDLATLIKADPLIEPLGDEQEARLGGLPLGPRPARQRCRALPASAIARRRSAAASSTASRRAFHARVVQHMNTTISKAFSIRSA